MRKLSLFLISLGFVYFLQFGSENEYVSEVALPYAASAEEASEEIKPIAEMVQGDLNAPIEIIEYASFTCPHCATFHADVYPKLKINYIDKGLVRFVYREVYFDKYGMWASMICEWYFSSASTITYDKKAQLPKCGEVSSALKSIPKHPKGLSFQDFNRCCPLCLNKRVGPTLLIRSGYVEVQYLILFFLLYKSQIRLLFFLYFRTCVEI